MFILTETTTYVYAPWFFLCALIFSETLALYKSFTYLLTYLNCGKQLQKARGRQAWLPYGSQETDSLSWIVHTRYLFSIVAFLQHDHLAHKWEKIYVDYSQFIVLNIVFLCKICPVMV